MAEALTSQVINVGPALKNVYTMLFIDVAYSTSFVFKLEALTKQTDRQTDRQTERQTDG